jgi:soluble lytic murein transglycosylase
MQLMPATAAAMAKQLGRPAARVYDPELNIELGSLYLLHMLDRFDGDETLALAAYNAGSGNVSKWMAEDGELPPRSLQYVENVQRARLRFVAMRQERQVPGGADDRTLLAAAPARPRAEVPPPPSPAPAEPRRVPTSAEARRAPAPAPVDPLAPAPDVYRPRPTPEPPLADTPYPPIPPDETETQPEPEPDPAPRPTRAGRAAALPSVLD